MFSFSFFSLPTKSWKNHPQNLLSPALIFHIIKCREQASVLLSVVCGGGLTKFLLSKPYYRKGPFCLKNSRLIGKACIICISYSDNEKLSKYETSSYHKDFWHFPCSSWISMNNSNYVLTSWTSQWAKLQNPSKKQAYSEIPSFYSPQTMVDLQVRVTQLGSLER